MEAARLLEEIVRDDQRAGEATSFWTKVAWIAQTEAAGRDGAARTGLRELIDEDRRKADQHTRAYAIVIWEQLFLAFIDRAHGREDEAERCDQETEALLTMLAADGEPKNWSNILALWAVLIGVTGRRQDPARPEGSEAPLFSDLNWAPLVDLDEPAGRAALARALADRTGMHVATRDFPPALRNFQQARRVAAGVRLS